jgi:hypothetical protein
VVDIPARGFEWEVRVGDGVNGQAAQPGSEAEGTEGGGDTPIPMPLPERLPCTYPEVQRVSALDDVAILLRVKAGLERL